MTGKHLLVTSSPHLHCGNDTRHIMLDVIIALVPAAIVAVWLFGFRALVLIAVCIASCVAAEYLSCAVLKKPSSVSDLSCVVTGLLLAFNLPSTLPIWQAALGCVVAIVVAKQMFGGIGHNFVNPALAGRIVLSSSFTADMTAYPSPSLLPDATSSATPLAQLQAVTDGSLSPDVFSAEFPLWRLLFGVRGGSLGETCALALLLGFVYLLVRRVITPTIPLIFVGTVFGMSWLLTGDVTIALYYVLSGGLLLGAIFMATDYSTSPVTQSGKVLFALGCGLITVMIRLYGALPEGVSYAIIIMNITVPLIEKLTRHVPFGKRRVFHVS